MEITRQAIEANPHPIYVKDQQGKFILTNSAYASLHGLTVEQLLEKGNIDSDYSYEKDLEVLLTHDTFTIEEYYKLKTGTETWLQTTKKVFSISDDSRYLLSVSADITVLKTALQIAEAENLSDKAELIKQKNEILTSVDAILGVARLLQKGMLNQEGNGEYIKTIISIAEGLVTMLPPAGGTTLQKTEEPKAVNLLTGFELLLVEDDPVNQLLAISHLESWKIKVELAENGEEAVAKSQEKAYDLILMDIQMPGMDGIEATKHIRTNFNVNQNTPIIAFTANVLNMETDEYKQAGFTDALFKPYHVSGLYQVVSRHVNRNKAIPAKVIKQHMEPAELLAATPLYDFSGLGNLAEDDVFIQKMKKLFIEMVPKQLEQIADSVQHKEWDEVAHLAHRLKSTYGNIKVNGAADAMKKLEEIARQKKNFDQVNKLLHMAIETTDNVITQFLHKNA